MDEEIYTLILQAKDEASAQMAEVSASMQRMAKQIEASNIIAGQSFAELNAQSKMMAEGLATTAAAATTHGATIATGLGTAARDVSSSFTAVEQDVTRFKQSMMDAAIVALPVVVGGGDAIKMAGDFEQAMLKIKGLTGATPEDLALWSPALIEMSRQGTQSAKELADGMYFVSSTNLHAADALNVLAIAQAAATGGMGKMNDLAQVLGGSLNAFVPQAQRAAEAPKYMDELTQAVVQGHMDPASLAPQIGRVGPQAAAMGVPFPDVLSMISTGTHVGMSTSVATTGTAGILSTLGAPGPSTAKGLEEVGIDPNTLGTLIKERGIDQVLEVIKQQIDITSAGNQDKANQFLKEIFPNRRAGGRYFQTLTNTGGDLGDEGEGGDANFYRQITGSIPSAHGLSPPVSRNGPRTPRSRA